MHSGSLGATEQTGQNVLNSGRNTRSSDPYSLSNKLKEERQPLVPAQTQGNAFTDCEVSHVNGYRSQSPQRHVPHSPALRTAARNTQVHCPTSISGSRAAHFLCSPWAHRDLSRTLGFRSQSATAGPAVIAGLGSTQLESQGELGMGAPTQLLAPLPTRAALSSVQMLTEGSLFSRERRELVSLPAMASGGHWQCLVHWVGGTLGDTEGSSLN